ncbi:hypothetical protein Tco_0508227 [Tanacetum coccineum]
MMSGQLGDLKNTVKIKQTTISELKECLRKKDSENEHLKSKIVDFTTVQNLRAQVKELQSENEHLKSKVFDFITFQTLQVQVMKLKSVNESLNLTVEELSKACVLAEATLRERDELISYQCKKMRLLEEQCEPFYEVQSEFDSEIVHDTHDNSEKDVILSLQTQLKESAELVVRESELLEKIDQMKSQVSELLEKLHISNQEMKQQIVIFKEDNRMFLAKNEFLEKVSSLVQKEYNDLLASNDVLKQRLETNSTFETKNLELVKEMGNKVKCFDEEKKVFETKISKLENVLTQRVKDFDDVKTELSRRTDKFKTYFANLEKENTLLKSQLASQKYTSLQKENND